LHEGNNNRYRAATVQRLVRLIGLRLSTRLSASTGPLRGAKCLARKQALFIEGRREKPGSGRCNPGGRRDRDDPGSGAPNWVRRLAFVSRNSWPALTNPQIN
jgi:hypothetical protein